MGAYLSFNNKEGHSEVQEETRRFYGWKRSLPDHRDYHYTFKKTTEIPIKVDLSDKMPKIVDQGQLGSCTANALAAIFEYDQLKDSMKFFEVSRLFIYYFERFIEGTVSSDSGAYLRDGMKVLGTYGVVPETEWPYNIQKFRMRPPQNLCDEAIHNRGLTYYAVDATVESFKETLSNGFPVIIGFSVPESFESVETTRTGFMKVPDRSEDILGGHAVVICGYDDELEHNGTKGYFKVRNSWGSSWGQQGYFWMPYDFVKMNMCADCWFLQTIIEE